MYFNYSFMTAEQNESKNRTVHYRKCEIVADLFTQLHGKTLENLLDEAFDKLMAVLVLIGPTMATQTL